MCKFFSIFGVFKFGEDCAYKHAESNSENTVDKLKKEIEHLKKNVEELMQNRMENDLEKIIEKHKTDICKLKTENEKKELRLQILERKYIYNVTNNEVIESRIPNKTENKMDECFQSEVVDGDVVYMCNFCDKGFSETNNVTQHLINTHEEEFKTFSSDVINTMGEKENKCLEKMCVDLKSCWCAYRDKEFEQELEERRTNELEKIRSKRN